LSLLPERNETNAQLEKAEEDGCDSFGREVAGTHDVDFCCSTVCKYMTILLPDWYLEDALKC
jgi:hypothetical protein